MDGIMRQYWRLGGVCGILFLLTFIIGGSFQGEMPTFDDPVEEIRAYWVDEGADYLLGDYIIGLGFMLFFFPFLSAFRSLLGAAEGGVQMWSRIVFGGGVLFLAMATATGIFWTTLAFGDIAENASDDTLTTIMALDVGAAHFIPAGLAIMILPAAIVILRTRVLPIWHGVLTLIAGILCLISPVGILADNPNDSVLSFLPFVSVAIWILITSIVLLMKKEAPVTAGVMGAASS